MRRFLALASLLLLAACSTASTPEPAPTSTSPTTTPSAAAQIPQSCDSTLVLPAVQKVLDNAEVIDTRWEPAEGTELADVINGGGLACTYGNLRAEVGVTVMWLGQATTVIDARESTWAAQGTPVSLEGVDKAWFIDPSKSNAEMPSWVVNAVVGDIWIQVRSGIGQTFEDSRDLVLSAVQSLRS